MKLNIARSLALFGAVVILGLVTSIGIQNYAFNKLRVNGLMYKQIIYGKDLVADILPPPLYVIEPYMLALEAVRNPAVAEANMERIATVLKPAYEDRRKYWHETALSGDLKQKLLEDVLVKGDEFWDVMNGEVAPALLAGNSAAIPPAFDKLARAFHSHEKAVNELVQMANKFQATAEGNAAAETEFLSTITLSSAAVSFVLLVGGLYMLRRRAIVPLSAMRDYMAVLASGDYSREVPYVRRSDEIGEMAQAVTVFRESAEERNEIRRRQDNTREAQVRDDAARAAAKAEEDEERQNVIASLGKGLERLSAGDLTVRLDEPFTAAYEMLREEFNTSVDMLAEAMTEISAATDTVRTGSKEIASGTDDLAQRTEQQAASLEQAASALDEITVTVKTSSERAREASAMMAQTKDSAGRSAAVVRDAVIAMEKIEESSTQIRSITNVIDEIAFQTNLLALNAGVEAARAGEAGKGFAVVAQEVRDLAGRSANLAKEINHLIETSSTQVAAGVSLVNRTGEALNEIDEQVRKVTGLVEAIVRTSSEQSTALSEVNAAVNRMDQVTQRNAAMVQETNGACRELGDEALLLNRLLARFRLAEDAARRSLPAVAAQRKAVRAA
ncbi:methyl-accepting chemotaxis protein [Rhizobium sp. BK251]|uniref:methyl-accepting chemotaxis protein n=1 Tax=Rhizobium sp. BK251 TaxID=2512125 RepID=UPI00104D2F4A|nr:methyl-accepting chemotaxis protein [Rhizobium sp. BK251]TCL73692.1 methyl-accepting chemotaxis protein [Rhizobium sp. BK251]